MTQPTCFLDQAIELSLQSRVQFSMSLVSWGPPAACKVHDRMLALDQTSISPSLSSSSIHQSFSVSCSTLFSLGSNISKATFQALLPPGTTPLQALLPSRHHSPAGSTPLQALTPPGPNPSRP